MSDRQGSELRDQRPPRSMVQRPGLERRLDAVPAGGLGLVVASAGSGKSVLVRQWLASQDGSPAGSLALTRRHDDPAVLAKDLTALVRTVAADPAAGRRRELRAADPGDLDAREEVTRHFPTGSCA